MSHLPQPYTLHTSLKHPLSIDHYGQALIYDELSWNCLTTSGIGCGGPTLSIINQIKIENHIGWSTVISTWDCHLIQDNDIGLLSTAAMKCLHWSLFCQKKSASKLADEFSKYILQKDEFSLGPVFHIPKAQYNLLPHACYVTSLTVLHTHAARQMQCIVLLHALLRERMPLQWP